MALEGVSSVFPAAGATMRVVASAGGAETYEVELVGSGACSDGPEIVSLEIPRATMVRGFRSSWGVEFEPVEESGTHDVTFAVESGRSSNGAEPLVVLEHAGGAVAVTIHWSGNWWISAHGGTDTTTVRVGLGATGQRPGAEGRDDAVLPRVSVATGQRAEDATAGLVRLLQHQVPAGAALLTEWNHWWPYEDAEIDESVFLANAAVAAGLGIDVAVLDAGWFGPDGRATEWYRQRGDWTQVNRARFPRGLAALAADTRALGIEFGLWVEPEAAGSEARIRAEQPELLARDGDGRDLGYVCLGSPAAQAHVTEVVSGLVAETGARWIKWDFNLDPGGGCARADHGHRPEEGLWAHYRGLYRVLDGLRAAHPEVVWEACSSGGLRFDAGLARHVDTLFLSDPDWTEHHLCCLWGACQLLPPRQLLHWPESEWRTDHRFQHVDYSGSLLTRRRFDTRIRAAMLHRFGISVRLTEMRPDLLERLRQHLDVYRAVIRPLLADAVLLPLTPQPLRDGRGCRQPAFQLDGGDRHVVAAFRLTPGEPWHPVLPRGLAPGGRYAVRVLDGADGSARSTESGDRLAGTGLPVPPDDTDSMLWLVESV